MRSPDARPHPLGPSPLPLIKSTPTSNRVRRKAATGVCYLSPVKSTTSEYFTQSDKSGGHDDVTEIQVLEGEVVIVEDKENECGGGGEGNCPVRGSGVNSELPLQSESPLRGTESSGRCVGAVPVSRTNRFYGARPHRPWPARHTARSVVPRGEGGEGEGGCSPVVESQGRVRSLPPAVVQPTWTTKLNMEYGLVVEGLTPVRTERREGRRRKRKGGGEERAGRRVQANPHAPLQANLVRLVSEMPELPNASSPTPFPPTSCDSHMTSTVTGNKSHDMTWTRPNLTGMPLDKAIDIILGVL